MGIVSESSEASIARRHAERARDEALSKASWSLRELTANILRVTRGAGEPYSIGRQAHAFVEALIEYRAAAGNFPGSEVLANSLSAWRDREVVERLNDEQYYAEQSIIRGALQTVASRLVGQIPQEAAGLHEMYDGVNKLEALREKQRK